MSRLVRGEEFSLTFKTLHWKSITVLHNMLCLQSTWEKIYFSYLIKHFKAELSYNYIWMSVSYTRNPTELLWTLLNDQDFRLPHLSRVPLPSELESGLGALGCSSGPSSVWCPLIFLSPPSSISRHLSISTYSITEAPGPPLVAQGTKPYPKYWLAGSRR